MGEDEGGKANGLNNVTTYIRNWYKVFISASIVVSLEINFRVDKRLSA